LRRLIGVPAPDARSQDPIGQKWLVTPAPQAFAIRLRPGIKEQFQAVTIRVTKVDRPADKMVDRRYIDFGLHEIPICVGEGLMIGHFKRDVTQACSMRRRHRCIWPNVLQGYVVVVCTRAQESIVVVDPFDEMGAQELGVERNSPIQVTYPYMDMT
jgi:hypothetical protein